MSEVPSRHYRVEELGQGIFAGVARPQGFAICNSGWVDLGEGAVVFDTGLTTVAAQELKRTAERTLRRALSLVVNSHFHIDHLFGNAPFRAVPIWSTRRTRELVLERAPKLKAELARSQLKTELRSLEARRGRLRTEAARTDLEFIVQIYRALLSAAAPKEVPPPDRTFDTQLELPGPRGAELASFGPGHTDGDAVLFLPREKILFAGDLVTVGVQPSMGSADPEHWLGVLDRLRALRPERIVPGHGPVSSVEAIDVTQAYLAGVLEAARASHGRTLPRAVRPWEGSVTFEGNLRATRRVLARRRRPTERRSRTVAGTVRRPPRGRRKAH